jgi:DNA-binding GntR family transcriptional regulator
MTQPIPLRKSLEFELQRPFLSKGEYVYHRLKENIVDGSLERNKIYTIVEIAESLGISRTPVGEAVKILGSQNYITLYPGVGFKVKEPVMEDIRNPDYFRALEEVILRRIIKDGPQVELRRWSKAGKQSKISSAVIPRPRRFSPGAG